DGAVSRRPPSPADPGNLSAVRVETGLRPLQAARGGRQDRHGAVSRAGERVDLDTFLAGLDEGTAAEARVAAAEIDRLARVGDAIQGIERRFVPWAAAGAVLFALGLWLLFQPAYGAGWWIAVMLAALPGVAVAYAFRVAPRTRADNRAEALNRRHFLPNGGLYFPPGEREAAVVRVDWTPPEPEPPISKVARDPRKRDIRPGRIW